jgi:hypothetical protein
MEIIEAETESIRLKPPHESRDPNTHSKNIEQCIAFMTPHIPENDLVKIFEHKRLFSGLVPYSF